MEVCARQCVLELLVFGTYLDQRPNVLVLNSTLAANLVEAAAVRAVPHRLVLEIALASLVANGAVEGVVGKQELHDALSRLVDERRVCLDDHAGLDGPCAGRHGLRGPLHLDQAHAATPGNHQLLVVAVSRDGASGLFARLDEGRTGCEAVRRGLRCVQWTGLPSIETFFPSAQLSAYVAARNVQKHKPMVSSTSAGRGAEAVKARLPLRAARAAGLFSDRINCCRSIVGLCAMATLVVPCSLLDVLEWVRRGLARPYLIIRSLIGQLV